MNSEKCILLVDDEANITRSIKRVCRSKEYKVLGATSAVQALEILATQSVQVVLSDQLMPEMTGAELFEKIQKTYPLIVRILLTGHTAIEGLTSAVNRGAVFRIMFKPWEDENLLQTIEDAFDYYEIRNKNKLLTQQLQEFNHNLENLVEQKTRELSLHVKRLQISQKLFDLLPEFALGINDELYIVEANAKAQQLLNSQALIGNKVNGILPDPIIQLINASADAKVGEYMCAKVDFLTETGAERLNITCIKINITADNIAYLVYGSKSYD